MTTATATKSLSINSAREFIDAINVPSMNVNLYITLSHVEAWANDSAPETPIDNTDTKINLWRSMVGGKKVTGYDVSLAIERIDWTANTVYTPYRNYGNTIFGTSFYVVTDDWNVYKCIDNNNGAASTIKPTYTSYDRTISEADGYVWKYMYSLTISDRKRFVTSEYIPVKNLTLNDGSVQWQVQQYASDGGIEFVDLTGAGASYNSNVSVAVSGDGLNADIQGTVNATSQTVSSIISVNPGAGYHFANVVISPISNTTGAGATANAIISPFGGHGSDPVEELGGSNVIINVRLVGSENGKITVTNDYRQIALVKNPKKYGSDENFSNTTFTQVNQVSVGLGGGEYILDEYVFQGTSLSDAVFSGRVVDWDSSNNILKLTQTQGSVTSSALVGNSSGTLRFVINNTNPELDIYSGSILYIDNIPPISRSTDQTEDIKIVLSF